MKQEQGTAPLSEGAGKIVKDDGFSHMAHAIGKLAVPFPVQLPDGAGGLFQRYREGGLVEADAFLTSLDVVPLPFGKDSPDLGRVFGENNPAIVVEFTF